MIRYNINFYLIKLNNIDGVFFDNIPDELIIKDTKDTKYSYDPIKFIDERIEEHMTQIIFLLHLY